MSSKQFTKIVLGDIAENLDKQGDIPHSWIIEFSIQKCQFSTDCPIDLMHPCQNFNNYNPFVVIGRRILKYVQKG